MRRQKYLSIRQWESDLFVRWRERERIASRHVAPRVAELIRAAGVRNLGTVGRILSDHTIRNKGTHRVIEERSGNPDGRPAFAVGVVDQAKPRRQVRKPLTCKGICDPRVAIEERSGRRICKNAAGLAGVKSRTGKRASSEQVHAESNLMFAVRCACARP